MRFLLIAAALVLGTSGCAAFSDDSTHADDGHVSVAAAF